MTDRQGDRQRSFFVRNIYCTEGCLCTSEVAGKVVWRCEAPSSGGREGKLEWLHLELPPDDLVRDAKLHVTLLVSAVGSIGPGAALTVGKQSVHERDGPAERRVYAHSDDGRVADKTGASGHLDAVLMKF